jgi:hypothetical protein
MEDSSMTNLPSPVADPQAAISPVGRIFGVCFSPQATFEDIVRKPGWLLPVVILSLLGLAVAIGLNAKMNWREYISQQIEKSPQARSLSAEQKEQRIEGGAKFAPISVYVFGVPGPLILVLVVGLIMWGAYNVLGGVNVGYNTSLSIVSHAYVPAILGNLVFLLVLFLKAPGTLDLDNPVATNLAAFFPEDSAKWLEVFGKNIDIFTLWVVALIAIGFAATNRKKLKGGASFAIAFGMFAVYLVVRVGLAFALS